MQRLRLEWTYHSNAIEGNSLDYGETRALLMHGVTAHGKPLKDHLDIRRHREVIEYLEAMVRDGEPVTQATLRGLHRQLMGETYEIHTETPQGRQTQTVESGVYKTQPNHVRTATGETHYYATPEETPARMTDLMDAFTRLQAEVEAGETHPLVAAATLHHGLVEIHPFADGNGRLARVLMNLLLMRAGFPPAVLREERRDAYFGALAEADAGDLQPFLAFVAEEMEETMRLYLRALRNEPDPEAVKRRIAILKQEITSEVPALYDETTKAAFYEGFILGLGRMINKDVMGISEMFSRVKKDVVIKKKGSGFLGIISEYRYGRPESDAMGRTGDWIGVEMRTDFQSFRPDPSKNLSGKIEFETKGAFCWVTVSGERPGQWVIQAPTVYDEAKMAEIAQAFLETLADGIEALRGAG